MALLTKKMKVIFLDIDGVLNVEVFINAFWAICKQMKLTRKEASESHKANLHDDFGNVFCPTACSRLAWIIEETGAKIVISSTWRHSGLEAMQEMWKARNLPGEVIDITPVNMDDRDLPFKDRAERGNEIKEWLNKNPVESYVIFDDDDDMLPEQENNFVPTDSMYGITNELAERAIKILNAA